MSFDLPTLLQSLGLSELEARLYLLAVRLGPSSASVLARELGVSRSAVYEAAGFLKIKRLMTPIIAGKVTVFAAEEPDRLHGHFSLDFERYKNEFDAFCRVLPQLRVLYGSGPKPRVRYFSGEEGMKALFDDVEYVAPLELREFVDFESMRENIPREIMLEARKVVNYDRTKVKMLWREARDRNLVARTDVENRLLPADFPRFFGNVWIYANRVVMLNMRNGFEVVMIDHQIIADTMVLLFDLAWKAGDEV